VIKSAFDSKVEGPVLLPQEMLEKTLPRIIVAPAVARLWVHVVNAEPLHVRQQRAEKNDTKKENVERAEHPRPAVNADGDDAGRGEKNEGVLVAQAEAHDRGAYERSAALAVVGKAHCDIEKMTLPLNRRAVRLSIPAAREVQPAQKYAILVAVLSCQ